MGDHSTDAKPERRSTACARLQPKGRGLFFSLKRKKKRHRDRPTKKDRGGRGPWPCVSKDRTATPFFLKKKRGGHVPFVLLCILVFVCQKAFLFPVRASASPAGRTIPERKEANKGHVIFFLFIKKKKHTKRDTPRRADTFFFQGWCAAEVACSRQSGQNTAGRKKKKEQKRDEVRTLVLVADRCGRAGGAASSGGCSEHARPQCAGRPCCRHPSRRPLIPCAQARQGAWLGGASRRRRWRTNHLR